MVTDPREVAGSRGEGGMGKKWLDSGAILKIEPIRFADSLEGA